MRPAHPTDRGRGDVTPPAHDPHRPPRRPRTEPVRPVARPIGMVLKTAVRRAVSGMALAAALALPATACGGGSGPGGVDAVPGSTLTSVPASASLPAPPATSASAAPSATPSGSPAAGGGTAADRVVYFSAAPRGPADGHQVLHDRAEVDRYAAAFAAQDPQAEARIVAAGRSTDFTRRLLVGWTTTTGCSAATGAALAVSGNRLELRVSQPEPPPECLVAFRMSVVFQVARERIPAQPVFG
ncbi:hypothetical protein [Streptomyces sp. NPDC049040]|uniref:hypothetical protein n=1 Tax=Streptomyces sp. NPDC049040 TaxID=3365593 RepID=UPI0037153802